MRTVDKGWGNELIFADEKDYCGKLLNFKTGKKFSMHFHSIKDETWYVLSGKFKVNVIETNNAKSYSVELVKGNVWRNAPLVPHQVECLEEGSIVEVSTHDDPNDNYRVQPGDSQT